MTESPRRASAFADAGRIAAGHLAAELCEHVVEGVGPLEGQLQRGIGRARTAQRAQRLGAVDAAVTVSAYPDLRFEGHVEQVGGTLDEATRTARVRVVVDNPDNLLRAGMFARVQLLMPGAAGGLTLPDEAVLEDEGRSFVFVRAEGPYFIRRPVTTGLRFEGWVEVSGITAGDEVVTNGAFLLKSDVLRSKMGAGCLD